MRLYYTIYKTTNQINGHYYYGKHRTRDLNDGYLGSGTYLLKAIEKYGRENFKKEVLCLCEDAVEMDVMERLFVNEEKIAKKSECYNAKVGGEGGDTMSGKTHKSSTKTLMREIALRSDISRYIKDCAYRQKGEKHPHCKLTWEDVCSIRAKYSGRRGQYADLAKEFGVHYQTIFGIVNNTQRLAQ